MSGPVVSITALMHGDEHAGILAIEDLVFRRLQGVRINGTIQIIPIANPLATLFFKRSSPFDLIDLNRIGIGFPEGEFSERLARTLFEIMKDSEYIINIHEFEGSAPLTCVYTNSGDESVRSKTLRAAISFAPEVIWSIRELRVSGGVSVPSFDIAATVEGTPSFAVEFSRTGLIDNELFSRFSDGVSNVLRLAKMLPGEIRLSEPPLVLDRRNHLTMTMGIWEPMLKLRQAVDEDEVVGNLVKLPRFEPEERLSEASGMIFNIRPREMVKANDILFSVGVSDEELKPEVSRIFDSLK